MKEKFSGIADEAILLAAGKGTRMKSELPKVLHEVCGVKLLDLVGQKIVEVPYKTIVVSQSMVEKYPNDLKLNSLKSDNKVKIAIQTERKGTGHAVKVALGHLEKSSQIIIIIYGDTPFIEKNTIKKAIKIIQSKKADLVVTGFYTDKKNEYGKIITEKTNKEKDLLKVLKIEEHQGELLPDKTNNGSERVQNSLCNAGFMAVTKEVLAKCLPQLQEKGIKKELYLTDLPQLYKVNNFTATCIVVKEEEAIGINSINHLINANSHLQDLLREQHIANGVNVVDPKTVYFSYDTKINKGTKIATNVNFGKGVVVGSNCTINSFSTLTGCLVGDNSFIGDHTAIKQGAKIGQNVTIYEFSSISECVIKDKCTIGPFAHIRPNTTLQEKVKIGNFVETKSSSIGANTKINHLSYIGDSIIGKNVNIGAGCVTCNYDGFAKHKTEIQDNSFIGSQTTIIAPLKIGAGAIVGAKSLLNKEDISDNTLVIPQAVNILLKNGATKFREKKIQKNK
ncbi:MAG: NTP transferase domain-containing protein [Alphaproteobacteria bacterium]|nr:NTP transferase domain-containing protein [Rickettsiales bacterium]